MSRDCLNNPAGAPPSLPSAPGVFAHHGATLPPCESRPAPAPACRTQSVGSPRSAGIAQKAARHAPKAARRDKTSRICEGRFRRRPVSQREKQSGTSRRKACRGGRCRAWLRNPTEPARGGSTSSPRTDCVPKPVHPEGNRRVALNLSKGNMGGTPALTSPYGAATMDKRGQ